MGKMHQFVSLPEEMLFKVASPLSQNHAHEKNMADHENLICKKKIFDHERHYF